jgi:hypothetical protein
MKDSTEFHRVTAAHVVVDQTNFFPKDCLPQEKAVDEKSSADLHVRKDLYGYEQIILLPQII